MYLFFIFTGLSRKHRKRLLAKTRAGVSIVEETDNIDITDNTDVTDNATVSFFIQKYSTIDES